MRIAFILSFFPALSETFILNQITGLLDRGHEVDIYALRSNNDPKLHLDVERYGLLDRTYYQAVPPGKLLRFVRGAGLIADNLRTKHRAILEALNVLKYGRASLTLIKLFEMAPFLDKAPYDIIHCHYGPNGNQGVLLREIGAVEGKIVVTFHGYDMSFSVKKLGYNLYRDLFQKGDLFLPISKHWADKLIELGCDEQKIVIHRMGIDVNKFEFCSRDPSKSSKVQLLSVARLVEKKGLSYGIQAVARVLQNYPDVEYKIVGEGHLRNYLEDLIDELDVSHRIKLIGWRSQEEIATLMQQAEIFIAPSVTDQGGNQEGIPVVLMEAMARGLPVVSTYHSGIPELVKDQKSGFLVPERDVDALTEKLKCLIENQELQIAMGYAGRHHVESYFDINKLNDQLVQVYQQLLSGCAKHLKKIL